YTLPAGAEFAQVTLERSDGTAPVSVTLTTSDGPAGTVPPFAAALAGTDYEALDTTVNFAKDEMSKTVSVALLPRAGTLPNRRFTVGLSSPTDGAVLGNPTLAEVRLLALDTQPPTLSVQFPSASRTFLSQTVPVRLTGTAGDLLG